MNLASPATSAEPQPWQEKTTSSNVKLLAFAGFFFLAITAVVIGFLLVLTAGDLLVGRTTSDNLLTLLILTVVCGVCLFGAIWLWPKVTAKTSFTPSYGQIAPDTVGAMFEVRFQGAGLRRTLRDKGTVQFLPNGLAINGKLGPSIAVQLGVVLVVTLVPLIVFGVGLGIIPAILIARAIGGRTFETVVPYCEVAKPALKGCRLDLEWPGKTPAVVALRVSHLDGERLYREARAHLHTTS